MGRAPCCDKNKVKKGPWTAEEDAKLLAYITMHGTANWTSIPNKAGLKRCGKSCRLRWTNYLRPDLKHERFTSEEEQLILNLHAAIGSRWSLIAAQLPGRTDNDVKNHWNTRLRKKLCEMGIDPVTHKPISQILADYAGNIELSGGCENHVAKARISCLTKDLCNTHSNYSSNPHHQNIAPATNNAHYSHDYDSNLWDVIAQLNTIKSNAAAASAQPDQSMMTDQFSCSKQMSVNGGGRDSLFSDLEVSQGNKNPHFIIRNTQQPILSWREFLMEEEEEELVPLHAQEEVCEKMQNTDQMIFPPSVVDSRPYPCHLKELQMPHMNVENATTRQNTLQMQMEGCPTHSTYSGSSCSGLNNNVWDFAPSEISPLDSLLLNCEYPLFWDFPDLQNVA